MRFENHWILFLFLSLGCDNIKTHHIFRDLFRDRGDGLIFVRRNYDRYGIRRGGAGLFVTWLGLTGTGGSLWHTHRIHGGLDFNHLDTGQHFHYIICNLENCVQVDVGFFCFLVFHSLQMFD